MKKLRQHGWLLVLMQFTCSLVVAQPEVTVNTPTASITTAEPLLATVIIKHTTESKLVLQGDSLGAWWILERQAPTVTTGGGFTTTTEKLLITCLDSGSISFPPLQVTGADTLFITNLFIEVKPPPADILIDFKPITEWQPLQPSDFSYWWLLPVLLAAIGLWWFLKRKKGKNDLPKTDSTLPAEDEWNRLLRKWDQQEINSEQLGDKWMEMMRRRVGLPRNRNKTVAAFEMVAYLKDKLPPYQLKDLVVYLTICQAAQFGKLALDQSSGRDLIAFGKQWQMREEK